MVFSIESASIMRVSLLAKMNRFYALECPKLMHAIGLSYMPKMLLKLA